MQNNPKKGGEQKQFKILPTVKVPYDLYDRIRDAQALKFLKDKESISLANLQIELIKLGLKVFESKYKNKQLP